MSLLYPFNEDFKKKFLKTVVTEFNAQRGTRLDPEGFELLLTLPFRKGDKLGILAVTKRQDDFLRLRLRLDRLDDYNGFGPFKMEHDVNHAASLWEVFWECTMILKKDEYLDLTKAQNSELYQGYLNSDHILRLEDGGRLATGLGSFVQLEH